MNIACSKFRKAKREANLTNAARANNLPKTCAMNLSIRDLDRFALPGPRKLHKGKFGGHLMQCKQNTSVTPCACAHKHCQRPSLPPSRVQTTTLKARPVLSCVCVCVLFCAPSCVLLHTLVCVLSHSFALIYVLSCVCSTMWQLVNSPLSCFLLNTVWTLLL